MGRRTPTESIVRIFRAFRSRKTWTQAELASDVGIDVRALRTRLDELQVEGMPLHRDDEPPHVYWSVPKDWFPGGPTDREREDILHLLWHSPSSPRRNRALRALLGGLQGTDTHESTIVVAEAPAEEEMFLPVIEETANLTAVRLRFYSRKRKVIETRHISVHKVVAGPPASLVATCHRSGRIQWFRIDNVSGVEPDRSEPFRKASRAEIERFLRESADRFHADEPTEEHVFFVREPDSEWVQKNLIKPMVFVSVEGGIRVTARAAGAARIARYVASLGGSAVAESQRLAASVLEIAQGTLSAAERAGRRG